MSARGVRLDRDIWGLAEKLAPLVNQNVEIRHALGHEVTPQDVIRMAARRGLVEMEALYVRAAAPRAVAPSTGTNGSPVRNIVPRDLTEVSEGDQREPS